MDDLALEVRRVDGVVVDDPERADAGRGQVEGGGGAEPARADQQDPRLEQLQLALLADLGDQQVAAVAAALLVAERLRQDGREAVPLPLDVPAREVDDVDVAELLERLRREGGAGAAGAVDDDARAAVGDGALDARLEVAARYVDRAGDVPLVPLVALADVDEDRPSPSVGAASLESTSSISVLTWLRSSR